MGGGASNYGETSFDHMSTAELTDRLSPSSQDVFLQYQDYCESCGLSPMESYLFLSAKFEELIKSDRENAALAQNKTKEEVQLREKLLGSALFREQKERIEKEVMARELAIALHELEENAKSRPTAGADYVTADVATEELIDSAKNTKSSLEERVDGAGARSTSSDAEHHLEDGSSPPVGSDMISRIFELDNNDFKARFEAAMGATAAEFENAARITTKGSVRSSYKFDPNARKENECSLCMISFEHVDDLRNHINLSEFHKRKEATHNKRIGAAREEALRLASLATKVVEELHEKGEAHSQLEKRKAKLLNPSKLLWRKAVHKVIVEHVTNQFVRRLERRIEVPFGVRLLHSTSKHFHRTKISYDLQFFLHQFDSVLEIAAHAVLAYNHKEDSIDLQAAGSGSIGVVPCPRIYLSYMTVQLTMMGIDRPAAQLTFEPSADSSKKRQLGRSFLAAETQAVIAYICNRLKVKHSKGAAEALYFDEDAKNAEVILRDVPTTLPPIPIQPETILAAWIAKCRRKPTAVTDADTVVVIDTAATTAVNATPVAAAIDSATTPAAITTK